MTARMTTSTLLACFIAGSLPTPALAYQATTLPYPDRSTYPTYPDNRGYAGTIRCESKNEKTRRCAVRTDNRVQLIRQLSDKSCREGRSWNYDRNAITVSRGCRADFAYGYGNHNGYPGYPDYPEKDKGPSTGAIIAGVAVAGGLIALLASQGKKKKPEETTSSATPPEPEKPATFPPGPPAAISADFADLPAEARPVAQTCLFEAARQIGATGGTKVRYDRKTSLTPGNGGWRIGAALTATYPDGDRAVPMFCRATPTKVVELTFG